MTILTLGTPLVQASRGGESVDRLGRHLFTVEQAARNERVVEGVGLLMLAAASTTGALLASRSSNRELKKDGVPVFGVLGGAFGTAGILRLGIHRQYEELPEKYRHMPERTPQDLKTKAERGLEFLTMLSDRARIQRYWFGSMAALVGAGFVTWYFLNPQFLNGGMPYLGGFCFSVGLVNFLGHSVSERELKRFQGESGVEIEDVSWGPLGNGGVLRVVLSF